MNAQISILITGSEVLDGRVSDTNSHYLVRELSARGFTVCHVLSCDDTPATIVDAIGVLLARSNALIISGGIGPTTDDNTRRAVADFLGCDLAISPAALAHLEALYRARRRVLDEVNRRQAFVPDGATVIENPNGTAPGFLCEYDEDSRAKLIFSLPGVPPEMRFMFESSVVPLLAERFPPHAPARHLLRVFGLPESGVGKRIEEAELDAGVAIAYRAAFPEVHVQLSAADAALVSGCAEKARAAIGAEYILAENDARPAEELLQELLLARKLSMAAAESCTGGLVSALLTNTAGSSACFHGSTVAYRNEDKIALLGVSPGTLSAHGAVSAETAVEMARGARRAHESDLAVAITGIAGPAGGSEAKPVGTFFVGYADASGERAYKYLMSSSRERVRAWAARTALDVVRRRLLNLPLPG